ncbi:MAG: TerB family tellurite resistance protein [Bacteroidetes bacterium]|nr:TerB family tellurite resistance protein [Bacteroidota bacterium]
MNEAGMSTYIIIICLILFVYAVFSMTKKKQDGEKSGTGNKYGKWIGGGLGWAFGGPIGAILGFAMGSVLDGVRIGKSFYQGTARGDFSMSLLVLSAAVMKADGKVVKSELEYVRSFFLSQFGLEETNRLIQILREVLNQEINLRDVSVQVGQFMDYPSRLQLLHYLFGIAMADKMVDKAEENVIEQISEYMGVGHAEFASIRAMFVRDINNAYDILELTPDATNDELKKAYRRLAVQYHPDKVAHLGEDVKKAATEKFQNLNAAYEEIKKQRGMI